MGANTCASECQSVGTRWEHPSSATFTRLFTLARKSEISFHMKCEVKVKVKPIRCFHVKSRTLGSRPRRRRSRREDLGRTSPTPAPGGAATPDSVDARLSTREYSCSERRVQTVEHVCESEVCVIRGDSPSHCHDRASRRSRTSTNQRPSTYQLPRTIHRR